MSGATRLLPHTVTTFPSARQIFQLCTSSRNLVCIFEQNKKKNRRHRNKHSRQPEARCTSRGYFRETNRHYIYTSPRPHTPCRNTMWRLTQQLESLPFQSITVIRYAPYKSTFLTGLEVGSLQQQTLLTVSTPRTFVIWATLID
jgi:hypothetical protein